MTSAPAWVEGIDASYASISVAQFQQLKGLGIRVFMQCLWTAAEQPPPRVTNLRNAQEAGIEALGGYISLNRYVHGSQHVDKGRAGVPDDLWDLLRRVPIDVEDIGDHTPTFANTAQAAVRIAALEKPVDVYTNWHTWVELLNDPPAGVGWSLWNAFWDQNPDLDLTRLAFGGWTIDRMIGEQYAGRTVLAGAEVDRNTFRAAAFGLDQPPAPTQPELPATNATDNQVIARLHREIAARHAAIAEVLEAPR